MIKLTMGFLLFCLKMVFETVAAIVTCVLAVVLAISVCVLLNENIPADVWRKKYVEEKQGGKKTAQVLPVRQERKW